MLFERTASETRQIRGAHRFQRWAVAVEFRKVSPEGYEKSGLEGQRRSGGSVPVSPGRSKRRTDASVRWEIAAPKEGAKISPACNPRLAHPSGGSAPCSLRAEWDWAERALRLSHLGTLGKRTGASVLRSTAASIGFRRLYEQRIARSVLPRLPLNQCHLG